MNKTLVAGVLMASGMIQQSVCAAADTMYAGLFFGQSTTDAQDLRGVINDGSFPGGISTDTSDVALGVYFGAKMVPALAVEFGYQNLGSFTATGTSTGSGVFPSGAVDGEIDASVFSASLLGMYHPREEFGLYGRLGGYRATTDASRTVLSADTSNFGMILGLGGQFSIAHDMFVRLEWTMYQDLEFITPSDTTAELTVETIGASLALTF